MPEKIQKLSRRTFLKLSAGVGAGLTIGVALGGCEHEPENPEFRPSLWLQIQEDDVIKVFLVEAEMGQGVATSLPMLLAEELEVSLAAITVEHAPLTPEYGNQTTGGSSSIRNAWLPMRQAGAAAREMLKQAAANTWEVELSDCFAKKGRIINTGNGASLSYGQLAAKAALLPVPDNPKLKDPGSFTLIGKPTQARDVASRVDGSSVYGGDVILPGMLTAAIKHCPVFGGSLASFDGTEALKVPGVRKIVPLENALAVVGDNFWCASRAIEKIKIEWNNGGSAEISSANIQERLTRENALPGKVYRDDGNALSVLANAKDENRLEANFVLPFQAHATMEPMCCVASIVGGECEIWVPTQAPSNAQDTAFETMYSGVPKIWHKVKKKLKNGLMESVKVNLTEMGGGFGRRVYNDFVCEAVKIALVVEAPIKLIWSREEDIQHDFYHPMTVHKLEATLDGLGGIAAWSHKFSGEQISPGGSANLPYSVSSIRVEGREVKTGVPIGILRSVDHAYNAFVTECFIDEVSSAAGRDPMDYRLELSSAHPRLINVLKLVAERSGWFEKRTNHRFLGVASHISFGSYVAQVAEVSLDSRGDVLVHKVFCAFDCGQMVNPDTVSAQVEGSIVFGLTHALKNSITISQGRAEQSNFDDYRLLRMNEMPELDIFLVESRETPGGVGEPAVPPVAPAVANAYFAATGTRVRKLPLGRRGV